MEDNFESYNEHHDYTASLQKFELMLVNNDHYFFDVEELEDLIDHYLAHSDTANAEKVIDICLNQHPSSNILRLKEAQYYAAIHKPNKALNILSKLEQVEPFNGEIFYVKANILSQLRQHVQAIESYSKAIQLTRDKIERTNLSINIAFEYENLGQYDKAIDLLKKILEENPANETVLYEIAFCYNLKDDAESSIDFFKIFIDENPYSYPAWYNLGIAYGKLELHEKAIDAYDFAIAIKENFSPAYFNKANCLAHLKRYSEAIKVYQETFLYEDANATTHYYMGECYEKLEAYEKAFTHYSKASELDHYYADAWAGMAIISDISGRTNAAIYYIEKAIHLETKNFEYQHMYGDILAKKGDYDKALDAYYLVVDLDETNEDIWVDIAEVLKEKEGIEQAIAVLYEGLEKQPKNYLINNLLVAFLLENGNITEAIEHLVLILTHKKELVTELTDYYPEIVNYPEVIELIENFES